MWGCLPLHRIPSKTTWYCSLLTYWPLKYALNSIVFIILSDQALNGGIGLKDRQDVLSQPLSPAFFDVSLQLRYLAGTSSTESKWPPQAFRTVVWLWYPFVAMKSSMRDCRACDTIDLDHLLPLQLANEDLSRETPTATPKRPSHN